LQECTQRLQRVFNAVYPQLVNRFALDPHSDTLKTVTLAFSSDLSAPAVTSTIPHKSLGIHPARPRKVPAHSICCTLSMSW
jgi:hypothetical protein